MVKQIKYFILVFSTLLVLLSSSMVRAQPVAQPQYESSPYDLVNAVNALRAAYGLPAYSINSILMYTAQNQADFMAVTGDVTHYGPGGIGFTDRLLAAGYPLAGNLSLGGFRAENITSGTVAMSALSAVDGWMGDAPHQNTMLSPNLMEIGGVAVVDGRVYYVIDCATPTTSSLPQVGTSVVESGSTVPAAGAVIYPVALSTPNTSGDVIHEVQSGQTLWQIAISYEVKIDDIKRLNNLFDNNIYPGDQLLVKKEAPITSTSVPPTETATFEPTVMPLSSATNVPTQVATITLIPTAPAATSNNSMVTAVIALIALAILGGGVFAWTGGSSKDKSS